MSENLQKTILRIKNSSVYQKLRNYYGQSTIFSALGIERKENIHSSFLCWLFDPNSDHQLGTEPLKKFLALYALYALYAVVDDDKPRTDVFVDDDELRAAFITGRYSIENVEIENEISLTRFNNKAEDKKQNRLDVWINFSVILPDSDNDDRKRSIILVIENKIYSKEGKIGNKYQTEVYDDYLKNDIKEDEKLLEVFLTPDGADDSKCHNFVHLTYQQMLDNVFHPLSSIVNSQHAKTFINDYIRNLGKSAMNDDENNKNVKTYSILATSEIEKNRLQELLNIEGMQEIIKKTLFAVYGKQVVKDIVGKDAKIEEPSEYEKIVLLEFWNDNIDILKAMLYNMFSESKKSKKGAIEKILKESNRDTTKYIVERKEGTEWIPADEQFKRPLSKGRAACVFFAQWMDMYGRQYSLEKIREEFFPVSINKYFANSTWTFFDTLIFGCREDASIYKVISKGGEEVKLDAIISFGFYPIIHDKKCGWGYTKEREIAIMPKMWRREDFQSFLNHIKEKKFTDQFPDLRIREVK